MTRPAVIIGLGGTGQWVTTYVKKELMEDSGGKMPENVRILCFDTWPEANAGGAALAAADVVSVGNTKLVQDIEFIPLSGNTLPKGKEVVEGRAPHIGQRISDMSEVYSWFDAPYFLQNVQPATWQLSIGAGQIRQFGRLGFFNHATAIRQWLEDCFTKVQAANPTNEQTQVMIIASFAGGTGAGMFLDMAAMARSLVQHLGIGGAMFRGIFVLPDVFIANANQESAQMRARAYAAWRELARFMNLGPLYGAHRIQYNEHTWVDVQDKPFDQVFLVDSNRPRHTFAGTKPENGVFPAIATFISTALDDHAGSELGNAVNQINQIFNQKLGFSSFGAYALQLPLSHIVHEYALQLERDLLRRWLAPQVEMKDGRERTPSLQPNQNQEDPNARGSQEVHTFMLLPQVQRAAVLDRTAPPAVDPNAQAYTLRNLRVLATMANLHAAFTTDTYEKLLADEVLGGYCRPGDDEKVPEQSWLGRLMLPEDYVKTEAKGADGKPLAFDTGKLEAEAKSKVRGKVPSSKTMNTDPTDDEARRIVQAVEDPNDGYIVEHYGGPGARGSFDLQLDQLVAFNRARFAQLLDLALTNTLNGTVADPYDGLSGRLGYVEDFCKGLKDASEWFQTTHMKNVKEARAKAGNETMASNVMQEARAEMFSHAGEKCVVFFNHPRAFQKQEEYLDLAQDYCEVLKDEKLLRALDTLAEAMKNEVARALAQVEQWKELLICGEDCLYARVKKEYKDTKDDLDNQAAANQSQDLYILRDYPADGTPLTADVIGRIDEQMKRIRWMVKRNSEGKFELVCEVHADGEWQPLLRENDVADHNRELLSKLGFAAWGNFGDQHALLDEIGRQGSPHYRTPVPLAQELIAHSEPMYMSANVGAGVRSALRRANQHSDLPEFNVMMYLGQIDGQQGTIHPPLKGGVGYAQADSPNKHKLALIQWVDRLAETDFAVYDVLRQSYAQLIRGGASHETASRLHIFPAEGSAAYYEHQMPLWLNQPVRELSPRMVLLLTEAKKVRMFFHAYALGFITHGRYERQMGRWWRLQTPGDAEHHETGQNVLYYTSTANAESDPFEVITAFGKGVDQTGGALIQWETLEQELHREVQKQKRANCLGGLLDGQFRPERGSLPGWPEPARGMLNDEPYRLIHELETRGQQFYNQYLAMHGAAPAGNPGWVWVKQLDYKDLADVGRMVYIELLVLEKQVEEGTLRSSMYQG